MRRFVGVLVCFALTACGSAHHAAQTRVGTAAHAAPPPRPKPFRATLLAPTHTPRAGPRLWRYSVRATSLAGAPLHARITVQVIDPLGTAHPAQYRNTHRNLVRFPFFGTFRDWVTWPTAARGYRFTFRVIVYANGGSRRLDYAVRVR